MSVEGLIYHILEHDLELDGIKHRASFNSDLLMKVHESDHIAYQDGLSHTHWKKEN